MQLFQRFSEYLLEVSGVPREQLECFADNIQTEVSGKDLGNCIELCQLRYDGVFEIEHFKGDAALFVAQLLTWLENNDPYRSQADLPDPKLEVSAVDRKLANVDLQIVFEESIIVREDPEGAIEWMDKKWSVCPLDIDVAEELESMDGKSNG